MLVSLEKLIEKNVKPRCILHVGAHEAEEMNIYKQMGCSNVLWIESMIEKHQILVQKTSEEPDMDVAIATVWSKDNETVTFYQADNGQSSSIFDMDGHKERYPDIKIVKQYQTTTSKIDTILSVKMKRRFAPDMIVLDIQGAELHALRGSTHTLKNVKWIYAEVSYEKLYKDAALEPELTRFLDKRGFIKLEEVDSGMGWGDVLYVRENLIQRTFKGFRQRNRSYVKD